MIRKVIYVLLCFFILVSCWNTETDEKEYKFEIINESNSLMKIAVFNSSTETQVGGQFLSASPINSYSYNTSDKLLEINNSNDYVPQGDIGDSAVIVLGDKYLIHRYDQMNKVFTPNEGNIFRISSYTQETPTIYRMELNQEDYDNASPCNDDPICGE